MGTTNAISLHYVEEATPGETPASPTFTELPIVSQGLIETIENVVSERIRDDRMIDDIVPINAAVQGPVGFEFSIADWKEMFVSLLRCGKTPVANVNFTGTDISVAAVGTINSTTTDFTSENVAVGQWLSFSGFSNQNNNTTYLITSVAANQLTFEVNLSPGVVDESAGNSVTGKGEMYRNNYLSPETYTFRVKYENEGNEYYLYARGIQVAQIAFNFVMNERLTGTMTLIGLPGVSSKTDTAIPGETLTPLVASPILTASSGMAALTDSLPSATVFRTMTPDINNNVNSRMGIGSIGPDKLSAFTIDTVAGIEIYFEDLTAYNLFKNNTGFTVAMIFTDANGDELAITYHNAKFETLEDPVSGKDQFFFQTGTLRSVRDVNTDSQVQLDYMV